MVCQELAIWFVLYWHSNLLTTDTSKLLVEILLRPIFSQSRRDQLDHSYHFREVTKMIVDISKTPLKCKNNAPKLR